MTARMLNNAAFADDPNFVALKNLYSFHDQQNMEIVSEPTLGKRKRGREWREEGREVLDSVVRNKPNFWNGIAAVDDQQWLKAVLNAINARFTEYELIFLDMLYMCSFFIPGHLKTWASRVEV